MFANLTPLVKNLLLLNIIIHFAQTLLNLDLANIFGFWSIHSDYFYPHQFFTYMFLHAGGWHLFSNMIGLFFFGPMLERFWGPKKFLIFYIAAGLGAGMLYGVIDGIKGSNVKSAGETFLEAPSPDAFNYFIQKHAYEPKRYLELVDDYYENPGSRSLVNEASYRVNEIVLAKTNGRMVGASGAVIAILTAFGLLFPNTVIFLLFPPIPIKAKYLVIFYGLYEIYSELNRSVGDNVAHLAHLSGMLVAIILVKLVWKNDRNSFY